MRFEETGRNGGEMENTLQDGGKASLEVGERQRFCSLEQKKDETNSL